MIRWRGEPDPRHVEAVDAYWVSAAEHGMNASTFTARVIAGTGADVAACLSGAVGALSGPLHGGAPSRALHMIEGVERSGDARAYVKGVLDRGERLMGFGHRVYRAEDPRAAVLRDTCRATSAPRGSRSPSRWSRPRSPSCASASRTACSRPTSSSGPRLCSTSPRSPARCSPRLFTCCPHRRLVGSHPGAEEDRASDPTQLALHRRGPPRSRVRHRLPRLTPPSVQQPLLAEVAAPGPGCCIPPLQQPLLAQRQGRLVHRASARGRRTWARFNSGTARLGPARCGVDRRRNLPRHGPVRPSSPGQVGHGTPPDQRVVCRVPAEGGPATLGG